MRRANKFLAVCGLAVGMLLSGGMAQAQTDKCQAAIEKEVEKLHKDALQRIHKCLDFAQKEKVKRQKRIDDGNADKPNWDWTKAAFLCEIQLLQGSKCTRDDLIKLRHQVPATQIDGGAPTGGASDISFVREFLKVTAIKRAVATAANANPDWRALLQNAIEGFPVGQFGQNKKGITDCSVPDRPALCQFHRNTPAASNNLAFGTGSLNAHCRVHECELDATDIVNDPLSASNSTVNLSGGANIPITLNGSLASEYCKLEEVQWVPAWAQDLMFIIGEPSRTLVRLFLDATTAVCVDGWAAEGWCACTGGTGGKKNPTICIDHFVDTGVFGIGGSVPAGANAAEDCNAVADPVAEECFCADTTAQPLPCGGLLQDDCVHELSGGIPIPCTAANTQCSPGNVCAANISGGQCHPSLFNSALISYTVDAVAGDCVTSSNSSITLVSDDKIGPDGIFCTEDDDQPTAANGTTIITSGQAIAELFTAVATPGECVAGPNTPAKCIRVEDCGGVCSVAATDCGVDSECPDGETCDYSGSNCFGAVLVSNFQNVPKAGVTQAGGCPKIETSNLQGGHTVNAFPFNDAVGLGDGTSSNDFVCR
jgi:hypothetical protein